MPFNLLLFPLVAGYCIIHICYLTRYRGQGLDGYRLLIECVVVGLLVAPLSVWAVFALEPRLPSLFAWLREVLPFDYSVEAVALLTTGLVVPALLNLVVWLLPSGKKRASVHVLRRYGDPLTRLFLSAVLRSQPILVGMEDGKIYVGQIVMSLGLNPKTRHIRLLPLLSGYRDAATKSAVFTTRYRRVYQRIEEGDDPLLARFTASDFQVVLPLEKIESARLFDLDVYRRYFQDSALAPNPGLALD